MQTKATGLFVAIIKFSNPKNKSFSKWEGRPGSGLRPGFRITYCGKPGGRLLKSRRIIRLPSIIKINAWGKKVNRFRLIWVGLGSALRHALDTFVVKSIIY